MSRLVTFRGSPGWTAAARGPTSSRWVPVFVAVAFLLPAAHPLLRPIVGAPSHLMWFAHVLAVALTAHRYGGRAGGGMVAASAVWVLAGEALFGAGYGRSAAPSTVLAMVVAVSALDFLVLGFAIWVRWSDGTRHELSRVTAAVVDHAPDALLLVDEDGRIVLVNEAAVTLFRASRDGLLGRPVAAFLTPSGDGPSPDGRVECVARRADGTLVPVEHVSTPVSPHGAAPGTVLITVRDTSRRLREEQGRRRTLALAEMGELVAGVAHELNNPLAGVLAYAELLEVESRSSPATREAVEAVTHEARRAAGIARRLLRLVRRSDGERQSVRMDELIRTALRVKMPSLAAHRIQVVDVVEDDLPPVRGDAGELEQVLVNLMANARQAMSEARGGGTLWVRAGRRPDGGIEVRVEDDGPGVPEAARERIFDPFVTTRETTGGTGLGLAIVRRIARAHGGDLHCEASAHGGAAFVLRLPASRVPAPAADDATRPVFGRPDGDPDPVQGRRVLVIDDEDVIRMAMRRQLERAGCVVDEATSRPEGEARLAGGRYDAVLCDIRIGEDSGTALYDAAIARQPALRGRFIFVTGDALSRDIATLRRGSEERWLAKPFEMPELLSAVRAVAASPAAGTPSRV